MIEITIDMGENLTYYQKYGQTKEVPLLINGNTIGTYKLFESLNNFKVLELTIGGKKSYIYSGYGLITSKLAYLSLLDFKIIDGSLIVNLNDEEWNEITNSQ